MKTEYIILKEAILTNNCPICYSTEGMLLSFKQEKLQSKFLVKTKGAVIESIDCGICENKIYPSQWTKDIELVREYHKKTVTAKPSSIRFTGLFFVVLFFTILLLTTGLLYVSQPQLFGIQS